MKKIVLIVAGLALGTCVVAYARKNPAPSSWHHNNDEKVPESVRLAVASGYPGYELVRCKEVNFGKGKKLYKLTLRKDRKTTNIYMDENGGSTAHDQPKSNNPEKKG